MTSDERPLRVLYRDGRFIACDKPSGVLTTRGDEGDGESLTERVRRELCPDAEVVHPLSRLDFDVSGVVVFAISYEATQRAANARAAGQYQREYHAMVNPALTERSAEWTWSIGVDPRNPTRRVAGGGREREDAHHRARARAARGGVVGRARSDDGPDASAARALREGGARDRGRPNVPRRATDHSR